MSELRPTREEIRMVKAHIVGGLRSLETAETLARKCGDYEIMHGLAYAVEGARGLMEKAERTIQRLPSEQQTLEIG